MAKSIEIEKELSLYKPCLEEQGITKFIKRVSCWAPKEEFEKLPDSFYGYWVDNEEGAFLIVGTTPRLGIKRLDRYIKIKIYTPETAWAEAQQWRKELMEWSENVW